MPLALPCAWTPRGQRERARVDAIDARAKAAAGLLLDIGAGPRLRVYLGIAPGAGKTRRMIEDALALKKTGRRVYIGTLETKARPDLT